MKVRKRRETYDGRREVFDVDIAEWLLHGMAGFPGNGKCGSTEYSRKRKSGLRERDAGTTRGAERDYRHHGVN